MVSNAEVRELCAKARDMGAFVVITLDERAKREEGREIIDTVQVKGLGFGPHPMGAIYFAERMRGILAELKTK